MRADGGGSGGLYLFSTLALGCLVMCTLKNDGGRCRWLGATLAGVLVFFGENPAPFLCMMLLILIPK